MKEFIKKLKKNRLFKFLSSVRLAVPLMLAVGTLVALGTFIESRYNAEYAKMLIYNTRWFDAVLMLLWVNIFCATISRIPFKKHHIGFVITHIGLLTLLIGSMQTRIYGIDGQLRIVENFKGRSVLLPEIVFETGSDSYFKKVLIPRGITIKSASQLSKVNRQIAPYFEVSKYLPFAEATQSFDLLSKPDTSELAIEFNLKSKFFNTNEWLHSKNKAQIQMGPATIKLVNDDVVAVATKKIKPVKSKAITEDTLAVLDVKTGKTLKTLRVSELKKKSLSINGIKISIAKALSKATVDNNSLAEGEGSPNPALILNIKQNDKSLREIVYAKYPEFSLNNADNFGLKFVYKSSLLNSQPTAQKPSSQDRSGNVVELHYSSQLGTKQVKVELYKNNKLVFSKVAAPKEVLTTPWMGMELTISSISNGGAMITKVTPVEPPPKVDVLPPSAIEVTSIGFKEKKTFWLIEGQQKNLKLDGEEHVVYYGRNAVDLPFTLYLNKFFKKNYPGTDRPISFESHVNINNSDEIVVISMNEPLQRSGYTLYQSSYQMNPGQPTASIFSVNRDPGRFLKYLGSLILSLGIIIFTLMRSRIYTKKGN